MSTWKASPFVAFTVTRRRPSSSEWTRALIRDALARELEAARGLLVFSLKGDVEAGSGEGGGSGVVGVGRIEELAEDLAGIAVPRDEQLVRVLDPLGEGHGTRP